MKTIAIATLIGLSLSFDALAENGHAYNGSYCDAYYGSQAGHFNRQHNGIRNLTAGHRLVSCPVSRQAMLGRVHGDGAWACSNTEPWANHRSTWGVVSRS